MLRRVRSLAVLAVLALAATPAAAQYPNKPLRLIVPFPAAGAADLAARVVAQPLSQALGQPVVVENKPGADGAIAADLVIKAAPDGYTLFFGTNTALCAVPALRKNPPYNPLTDFTPVSLVGKFGFFLFVHPDVPAQSVAELLVYARANPGKLNYATGNSTSILATAQLKLLEHLDMVEIPYKGDAPATSDLVAGRVQLMFATPGTAVPFVKDGKLRALATLLPTRSSLLPDVPTMVEAGLPQISIVPWGGLFGPAKMPKEVVDRLASEMAVVLARPEVREQLDRYAFDARSSTPEELAALLKEQLDAWRRTVREVGIAQD
jgi:tripartite-type tricarboxylate transporter receptor subunit TctC